MMTIPEIALAWLPLVDAVAKTTMILLAAAVASVLLRHASAALRHLVWTLALTSALVLPIASLALPKWQLPLFTVGAERAIAQAPATVEPADTTVAAPHEMAPPLRRASEPSPSTEAASEAAATASLLDRMSWQQMLGTVWLIGATVILARILVGLVAIS